MGTTTWLTPPRLLTSLGGFDLDPCCPSVMPWRTANRMIFRPDDGLSVEWTGRVWLNPPFGKDIGKWVRKMALHNNGIALLSVSSDTRWFHEYVFGAADALLFWRGRISFYDRHGRKSKGTCQKPIVLVAYGAFNAAKLQELKSMGQFWGGTYGR